MVVLATKIYVEGAARDRALDSLETLLANAIGDLEVETTVGLRHDGFPSVTITGPDATASRTLLADEWGLIEPPWTAGDTYIGTLEEWDAESVTLDAGEAVRIPAAGLGLSPGDPTQIVERFGLVQHQRLRFEWGEPPTLAESERDRLYEWQRGDGRVNVNSVTRAEAKRAVGRAGHGNDITGIDRLGLLEQSIRCAPGTDPPGMLASLGPSLSGQMRCVIP